MAHQGLHHSQHGWGWHSRQWARRCKVAAQHLQRHLQGAGSRPRWGHLGWGTLAVSAAAAPALPSPDSASQPPNWPPAQQQRPKTLQDFGHEKRRTTDTLLVLNCLAFLLQWLSEDRLTYLGAKVNALIAGGQWYRLLTASFLHSSVWHLLVNSHALHSIGPQLEVVSGGPRLAAVYLTAAVSGTLASYLRTPSPSIGASGALFGCGAALALFYWRHKEVLQQHSDTMLRSLGITLALNLGYAALVRNVDNWGHLGGALGGLLVAWALGPRMVRSQEGRFVDQPPLPWLAYSQPVGFSAQRTSQHARKQLQSPSQAAPAVSADGQAAASSGKEGSSGGRRRKRQKAEEAAQGQNAGASSSHVSAIEQSGWLTRWFQS